MCFWDKLLYANVQMFVALWKHDTNMYENAIIVGGFPKNKYLWHFFSLLLNSDDITHEASNSRLCYMLSHVYHVV